MKLNSITKNFLAFLLLALFFPPLIHAADELYDAPGFDPNRETFTSMPNENIDTFTGGLTLIFEDIRLPGNGGLDLVIQRTYNSKNTCNEWTEWMGSWGCTSMDENTWLGYGWTLHFGRFFRSNNVNVPHVIEMPDGSRHPVYGKAGAPSTGITKDYWLLELGSTPVLTLTNGTKIFYGASCPSHPDFPNHFANCATKIKDVNDNEINIYYVGFGTGEIDYVIDSVKRRIEFTTATINAAKRLISISGPGVSISYAHQPTATFGRTFLIEARPPVGNPWKYAYDPYTFELTKLTTPSGGEVTYKTELIKVDMGFPFYYRGVTQKTTGGTVTPGGTWSFSYSQGPKKDYTQITDPCERTIKYSYYGYGEDLPNGSMWKIGLPKSKEIVGEETVTYEWTHSAAISNDDYKAAYVGWDSDVYVPLPTRKSITRDGKTYVTNYSNYDNYANPQTISETGDKARNRTLTYWYNTALNIVQNKPASETISGGFPGTFTTTYTYDPPSNKGNLKKVNRYGVVTKYDHYPNGNLKKKTDANEHYVTYEWDNGRVSKITKIADGIPFDITRKIKANGTIESETNGRGYTTYFGYDDNLRLTSITPPAGNPTYFTYPPENSYRYETRGKYYIYHYNDGFGRPTGTHDIKGIATEIAYKACDPKKYSTSNIGDTVNYDTFGRVKKITHQDANTIIYNYTNSNLTITNEAGKNTEFTYNAFGNPDEKLLMSVKDALGYTSSYNYSILGSLTNITQGSVSRTFHYNSKNFLDYETHPEKGTINYTRDNVGNMWTKQDSLGTTSYVYDELDRLRTINYGTGTITFTYDNENNRKTMNYPSGSVTYTHDPSNRLTNKEETILGILYTTGYVYNGNDYVTDIYYPSKNHVIYTYNDKNEVTLVTGSGWDVHDMAYYKDGTATGLPKSFRYSNNVVTDLTYNKRNLTTSIQAGSLSSVLDMAYAYKDPRGNMTSMTKNYLDPSNSPGSKLNELIQTVGGMPAKYTYQNNRLASISGAQSFSMDYNTDGDATYMNDGGLEYTLGYDRLHNLTSFKHKGAPLAEFSYDGDGRRKVKTSAAGKVVYHYDAGGRVLSETGINGNLISDYVYANGKLVAKRSPTAVYFYHTDPAGTPLAMTDSAGNLVWRGDYLPFGEENLITATEQNDYKFVGKELDKETGLYYFGARYMEATIGRFISSDPMEAVDSSKGKVNDKILLNPQGLNRYAYSLNNPYRYLDPDGRIWVTIETTRRTHLLNNLGRGILGWISKEIGEGMPIRRGRPPFSDPGELIGEKRDVIQEWQPDLKHPELDEAFPYGSRRIIEQTNQEADPRDYLRNDPDKPVYDYFPRVPDRTYQNYPNVKYDYSNVDPEDKKSYLKQDTSSTGLNYPVIRPAP